MIHSMICAATLALGTVGVAFAVDDTDADIIMPLVGEQMDVCAESVTACRGALVLFHVPEVDLLQMMLVAPDELTDENWAIYAHNLIMSESSMYVTLTVAPDVSPMGYVTVYRPGSADYERALNFWYTQEAYLIDTADIERRIENAHS